MTLNRTFTMPQSILATVAMGARFHVKGVRHG